MWALFFQPACCWRWVGDPDPDNPAYVEWVNGFSGEYDYVDPVLPARAICKGGDSCCDGIECGVSSHLNLSSSLLLLGLKVYIYCLAWVFNDPVKSSDTKCLFEDCDWMFTSPIYVFYSWARATATATQVAWASSSAGLTTALGRNSTRPTTAATTRDLRL